MYRIEVVGFTGRVIYSTVRSTPEAAASVALQVEREYLVEARVVEVA